MRTSGPKAISESMATFDWAIGVSFAVSTRELKLDEPDREARFSMADNNENNTGVLGNEKVAGARLKGKKNHNQTRMGQRTI